MACASVRFLLCVCACSGTICIFSIKGSVYLQSNRRSLSRELLLLGVRELERLLAAVLREYHLDGLPEGRARRGRYRLGRQHPDWRRLLLWRRPRIKLSRVVVDGRLGCMRVILIILILFLRRLLALR